MNIVKVAPMDETTCGGNCSILTYISVCRTLCGCAPCGYVLVGTAVMDVWTAVGWRQQNQEMSELRCVRFTARHAIHVWGEIET